MSLLEELHARKEKTNKIKLQLITDKDGMSQCFNLLQTFNSLP